VFFGGQTQHFHIFTLKIPKNHFGHIIMESLWEIHLRVMHRDTMLKSGRLFDLAKFFEHT